MLSKEERSEVYKHAYLPEHLPNYVEAISGAEPYLHGDFLCFSRKTHLIFIGFPLRDESGDIPNAYESACERFRPETVAILAPEIWLPAQSYKRRSSDSYYRLDLPLGPLDPEVAYMIRRAGREIEVTSGTFRNEHKRLIKDFLSRRELNREHRDIFQGIPRYLKHSGTARLLEARRGDHLAAFSIVDLGATGYGFYLFNFRSVKENVPGASDLLLHEMVRLAQAEGKKAMNLGLGIHPGVRRFKEKWGAVPFLPHASALVRRKPMEMGTLINKL